MTEVLDRGFCDSICPLKRSKFNIIWSCLSTVLICSWTSVHPNVPARNEWLARANRLRLMFWMIVAPELVLAWAVRQRYAAQEIRDTYNNCTFSDGEGEHACGHIYSIVDLKRTRLEEMDKGTRPFLRYGRLYCRRPKPQG